MEKGGAGGSGSGDDPATSAAGGMCDRFLTFLARNLTMSKVKSIADGPRNGAGHPPPEGGEEDDDEEEDEFAIPIERAEFDDYEFAGGHGDGGYSAVPTILEESAAATATKTGAAADDAPAGGAAPAPAAAVEEKETKVRKSVTIKEEHRAEQEGGGAPAAPALERKRSLFKKRTASSAGVGDGAGGEQQGAAAARVPRRAGLRPRMPAVLRVPSNINERSSTFIEERRKSFGGRGSKAPATDK